MQQSPLFGDSSTPLLFFAAKRAAIRRIRREETQYASVPALLRLGLGSLDKWWVYEVVAMRQAGSHDKQSDHVALGALRAIVLTRVQHVAVKKDYVTCFGVHLYHRPSSSAPTGLSLNTETMRTRNGEQRTSRAVHIL